MTKWTSQRARLAAFSMQAKKTEAERTEHARLMAEARWAKHRAERAAAGLPEKTPRQPMLPAADLLVWLERVDAEFPDEVFPNLEARKRRAILLARRSMAADELKWSEAADES